MRLTPIEENVGVVLPPFAGKRCLITGASGFLGRNLIAALLQAQADVHILLHRRSQQEIPLAEHTQGYQVDLSDQQQTQELFAKVRPDYVFHLATPRSGGRQGRDDYIKGNILGADSLIRAMLKWRPKRVVVAQSSLEFGPHATPLSDQTPLKPNTLHGASKAAAALLFQQAASEHSLPIVLLRPFSVYGYWEISKHLIPTAMRALLQGETLPLTAGHYQRDFVFVADVIEAFLRAASLSNIDGEAFNIGTGLQTSNDQLVQRLQSISGRRLRVDKGAYKPHATDTACWCADIEKTQQRLQWSPQHSLDEGLTKTWNWFQQIMPRYEHW